MNELSPMHLVLILIIVTLIIPVQQILRRAGYSGWLCLLALIPLVNWIALWVFAFAKWPALAKPRS